MYSKKYDIDFNVDKEIHRLTNQVWKLIPMRENDEDWKRQLNIVRIEIAGLKEIFDNNNLLEVLSKLEGLLVIDTEFDIYRTTIFRCISLLGGEKNE